MWWGTNNINISDVNLTRIGVEDWITRLDQGKYTLDRDISGRSKEQINVFEGNLPINVI